MTEKKERKKKKKKRPGDNPPPPKFGSNIKLLQDMTDHVLTRDVNRHRNYSNSWILSAIVCHARIVSAPSLCILATESSIFIMSM